MDQCPLVQSFALRAFASLLLALPLAAQEKSARQIAALASPAVVTVSAMTDGEVESLGTGFIIREDGVLATNLHVVSSADSLRVELASGEIYDNVYVIGRDDRRDLIVLQIPAKGLPTLEIGDDRTAEIGDRVYVMGNPLGLDHTFSDGLLSAKRIEDGVQHLQITAPISQGSSGGPVFDSSGKVIGVATLIYTAGQNLNVAMPSRYASGLLALASTPVPFETIAGELHATRAKEPAGRIDTSAVMEALPADVRAKFEALEPWEREVGLGILAIQAAFEDDGWKPFDDGEYGALEQGAFGSYAIRLSPGHYQAIGTCDNDCSDLDIVVVGPDAEQVGKDVLDDALPVVEFSVSRRGEYTIGASVQECSTENCFYAVKLLRQK